MVPYPCVLALGCSPAAGCVAPLHVYIQIYFQADMLQMKSRSPKFAQIPKIRQVTAKTATGNGNLQPEIEINEYSSSKKLLE